MKRGKIEKMEEEKGKGGQGGKVFGIRNKREEGRAEKKRCEEVGRKRRKGERDKRKRAKKTTGREERREMRNENIVGASNFSFNIIIIIIHIIADVAILSNYFLNSL